MIIVANVVTVAVTLDLTLHLYVIVLVTLCVCVWSVCKILSLAAVIELVGSAAIFRMVVLVHVLSGYPVLLLFGAATTAVMLHCVVP